MEQEEQRLLSDQKEEGDYFAHATRYKRQERSLTHRAFPLYVLTIHVFLILSILSNVYQSTHARGDLTQPSICTSTLSASRSARPLTEHMLVPELTSLHTIVKTEHPAHGDNSSNYAGQPSNLTAATWKHLLDRMSLLYLSRASRSQQNAAFYFNISDAELTRAGFSSSSAVRVKGGGYLASLGVYHQLHCLVCVPLLPPPPIPIPS
jgi:hypothetical protein